VGGRRDKEGEGWRVGKGRGIGGGASGEWRERKGKNKVGGVEGDERERDR